MRKTDPCPDMSIYLMLMLLVPDRQPVSALSSMGNIFMVTSPRLWVNLVKPHFWLKFHLSTFSASEFKVHFSVLFYKERVTEDLMLHPGKVKQFTPAKTLVQTVEVGPTWTFRFVGDKTFGLTVVMLNSAGGLATFQALPVEYWGTVYYAVTGMMRPFIQVTSEDNENKVAVILTDYRLYLGAVFVYEDKVYQAEDTIEFTLKRWESFAISNCSYNDVTEKYFADLDGTEIHSRKPIGVITGSCGIRVQTTTCQVDRVALDMMAEMLFPTTLSRRAFLFPNIPGRVEPGQLVYVTWDSHSNVTIFNEVSTDNRYFERRRVSTMPVFIKNYVIVSNTGIFVLYVQPSVCEGQKSEPMDAGPNLCLIIPTEYFHYRFIWRTPNVGTQNFLLIVARVTDREHLLLDSKPLPSSARWERVYVAAKYSVGNVPVSVGDHALASSRAYTFACYVYGIGKNSSYMHVAGFQDCGPDANESAYGDLVDTNCDGLVEGYVVKQGLGSETLVFIIVPILLCGVVLCIGTKLCTRKRSPKAATAAVVTTEDVSALNVNSHGVAADSVVSSHHTEGSNWGGMPETASSHGSARPPSHGSTKAPSHSSAKSSQSFFDT